MVLYFNPLPLKFPSFMHVKPREVLLSGRGNYVVRLL